jgi:DNA helicase II / ATP-dependent DNA helicase PcrA
VNAPGPPPELRRLESPEEEARALVDRVAALHSTGVPYEETAILYRTNARSADFEEALHAAGIPFQGAALLAREGARGLLKALRRAPAGSSVAEVVAAAAAGQGLLVPAPDGLGERELTRQNDLARLVRLAEEYDGDGVAGFVAHLHDRFGDGGNRGVHLLTYHRAKGLEFDAVFLPRLEEKELPSKLARTAAALAEERRLLYVGLTRARRHLLVTWSGKPSRFLRELGVTAASGPAAPRARTPEPDDPAYRALKSWRLERARADDLPAYVVFHNATLEEIARRIPRSLAELGAVPGVGPAKLERYGEDVLAALATTAPS